MPHLKFRPYLFNLCACARPIVKRDGSKCYDYALLCADFSLLVSESTERIIRNKIGKCLSSKKSLLDRQRHALVDQFER